MSHQMGVSKLSKKIIKRDVKIVLRMKYMLELIIDRNVNFNN